ncbi:hypothetical protein ABZ383_32055 [Streptomyces sp. NPDC005900]|uniref:hypothetical protein n=1 Tax=Streptomyces sp. NPDC005900 TaxID=3154569 RepID=UPI0033F4D294
MPVPRDDNQRIAGLQEVSAHLRQTGHPEYADRVDFVLTDEGAKFLNRMRWGAVADGKPNLALSVTPELRARLKALASENGTKLEETVREGFAKYIAGDWLPPTPTRARSASGVDKVNLNIRTSAEQRKQMRDLKADRSQELGFQVADSWVALAWLLEEFGLSVEDNLR